MTKLVFTDVGIADSFKKKNSAFLVQAELSGSVRLAAIVFQCILNRDVDGAPRCYARFNPANPNGKNGGLDFLANATSNENAVFNPIGQHNWNWVGVVSMAPDQANAQGVDVEDQNTENLTDHLGRLPVFQPGRQFYVSSTAAITSFAFSRTDQRRYWDASSVSYGAVTPPLKRAGVGLGDFGVAIRNDTGVSEAFFYADAGGQEKVGEMSMHLFDRLFPYNDQEEHPVTFMVFPGSGDDPPEPSHQESEIASRLWWLSQTDNVSQLIDVMASGRSFFSFSTLGDRFAEDAARRNIVSSLVYYGNWRFDR
jgi:hypothetical protein